MSLAWAALTHSITGRGATNLTKRILFWDKLGGRRARNAEDRLAPLQGCNAATPGHSRSRSDIVTISEAEKCWIKSRRTPR